MAGRKKVESKIKVDLPQTLVNAMLQRARESYVLVGRSVPYSKVVIEQVEKDDPTWFRVVYRNDKSRRVFCTYVGLQGNFDNIESIQVY